MLNYVPWMLALYGLYKFMQWCRKKNLRAAYTNWFLRELEKEVRADPVYFEKAFGVKLPK